MNLDNPKEYKQIVDWIRYSLFKYQRRKVGYLLFFMDIEDIIQEILIACWKHRQHIPAYKNVKHYVIQQVQWVTGHKNRDYHFNKRKILKQPDQLSPEIEATRSSPGLALDFFHFLKRLPPLRRTAFILYLQGYKFEEIAKLQNVSRQAVQQRIKKVTFQFAEYYDHSTKIRSTQQRYHYY